MMMPLMERGERALCSHTGILRPSVVSERASPPDDSQSALVLKDLGDFLAAGGPRYARINTVSVLIVHPDF